jgi:hypothetical protein
MLAFVVALALGSAQQPAGVEIVGPAPVPSVALRQQLRRGEDEFVLFDVAFGVREVVAKLRGSADWIERDRLTPLCSLVDAIERHTAAGADPAAVAVHRVAEVAAALIPSHLDRASLSAEQRAEIAEVEAAANGTLRFLPQATPHDWAATRPRGGYWFGPHADELVGLSRATQYLCTYLARWPTATAEKWLQTARAVVADDTTSKLADVDRAMAILFGAGAWVPGLPGPAVARDLAWLHANAGTRAGVHDKLAGLFAAVTMPEPRSLHDGVLRLAHVLTTAGATDPLFGGMPDAHWQEKWAATASFAYVDLRDMEAQYSRRKPQPTRLAPTIVIEPLPEVWAALRWLEHRHRDLRRLHDLNVDRPEHTWVDLVIEALAHQQRGEKLPAELHAKLRDVLLLSFDAPDHVQGTESDIEGVTGRVRRAEPQLVRVPIVWRGEPKKALALRLSVEEHAADGTWHGPRQSVAPQAR